MKLLDLLEKIFPKPRIPQKRYIILFVIAMFAGAELYVKSTPSPTDDIIFERARELVFQMLAEGKIVIEPSSDNDLDSDSEN